MSFSSQDSNHRPLRDETQALDNDTQSGEFSALAQRVRTRYGRTPSVIANHFTNGLISRIMRWSRHAHFPRSLQRSMWPGQPFSELLYRQKEQKAAEKSSTTTVTHVATTRQSRQSRSASHDKLSIQRLTTPAARSSDLSDSPSLQIDSERANLSPQAAIPAPPAPAQNRPPPRRLPSPILGTPRLSRSIVRRYISRPAHRVGQARLINSAYTSSSPAFVLAQNRGPSPHGTVQRQTSLPKTGLAAVRQRAASTLTSHPAQDQILPAKVPAGAEFLSLAGPGQLIRRRLNPQRPFVTATQFQTDSAAVAPLSVSSRDDSPGPALLDQTHNSGAIFRSVAQNRPNDMPVQRKVGKSANQPLSVSGSSLGVVLQKRHLSAFGGQRARAAPGQSAVHRQAQRYMPTFDGQIAKIAASQPAVRRQARTDLTAAAPVGASSKGDPHTPPSPTQAHRAAPVIRAVAQNRLINRLVQRKIIGKPANQPVSVSGSGLGVVLQKPYLPPVGAQTVQAAPSQSTARRQARTDSAALALVSASSRTETHRAALPTRMQDITPVFRAVVQNKPNDRPVQNKRGRLKHQPISVSGSGLGPLHQRRHLPLIGGQTAQLTSRHTQSQSAAARFAHLHQNPTASASRQPTVPVVERVLKSATPVVLARRAAHDDVSLESRAGAIGQTSMPIKSMIQATAQIDKGQPVTQTVQSQDTMSIGRPLVDNLPMVHGQRRSGAGASSAVIQTASLADFPLAGIDRGRVTESERTPQSGSLGIDWPAAGSGISSVTAVQRAAVNSSQPSPADNVPGTGTGSSSSILSDLDDMDLERLADKVYHIIEQRLIFERESMGL